MQEDKKTVDLEEAVARTREALATLNFCLDILVMEGVKVEVELVDTTCLTDREYANHIHLRFSKTL